MKQYQCPVCNKNFVQKTHLQAHLNRKRPCQPNKEQEDTKEPEVVRPFLLPELTDKLSTLEQQVRNLRFITQQQQEEINELKEITWQQQEEGVALKERLTRITIAGKVITKSLHK